jgi:hypothetical protein
MGCTCLTACSLSCCLYSQIFQDLLRRSNGNREEATRLMAQLGLEFDAVQEQAPPPAALLLGTALGASSNAPSSSSLSVPRSPDEGLHYEVNGARHLLDPAFPQISAAPERPSASHSIASCSYSTADVGRTGSAAASVAPPLQALRPRLRSHSDGQALLRTYQVYPGDVSVEITARGITF